MEFKGRIMIISFVCALTGLFSAFFTNAIRNKKHEPWTYTTVFVVIFVVCKLFFSEIHANDAPPNHWHVLYKEHGITSISHKLTKNQKKEYEDLQDFSKAN